MSADSDLRRCFEFGPFTVIPERGIVRRDGDNEAYPGETPEERKEREQAETYYCERAQQIYDSYLNAPRLYKTSDDGTRVYLSDEESEITLSETKAQVDELCN